MSTPNMLHKAIESLSGVHVLVVGDVMLDRFVSGSVDRISPEAPIPILHCHQTVTMPGGAGNVLANIRALGGRADLLAPIGDDTESKELLALLLRHGPLSLLHSPAWRTIVKTRFMADGQQLLRVDEEVKFAFDENLIAKAHESICNGLSKARAVVLSDYGKGFLSAEFCSMVLAEARKADCPTIVDPKCRDYERYRGADYITPNRKELAEASGMHVGNSDEIVAAARALIARFDFGAVLATRSEEGMTFVPAAGECVHIPTVAQEVFDVSGAGDTVVSALAASIAAQLPIIDALHIANAAAGIVVGKLGTAVVHIPELQEALHAPKSGGAADKVCTLEEIAFLVKKWQLQNLRVGFTNGCFDVLHLGHLRLLEFSRAHCDRLVVAINSDASVRRLKGKNRPYNSEGDRAELLASITAVDAVVLFEEDDPLKVIERLRPNVLVKGADYTIDQIIGADVVLRCGGEVLRFELVEGKSTTSTLGKIRESLSS